MLQFHPVRSARDVADLVKAYRAEHGVTQAELAARAGLTRLSVSSLERGVSRDLSLNHSASLAETALLDLLASHRANRPLVEVDPAVVAAALADFGPDRAVAVREAADRLGPEVVAATLAAERLDLSVTKAKVLWEGVMTEADPLTVCRAREVIGQYRAAIGAARRDPTPELAAVTPAGTLREGETETPAVVALRFVCRALRAGAHETDVLFQANAYLVNRGLPWLFPDGPRERHDDSLAKLKMTGDGMDYVDTLFASLPRRRWAWCL